VIRDARVSDHHETVDDLPFEVPVRGPPVRLPVRVVRADGTPAAGVLVRAEAAGGGFQCARSDPDGALGFRFPAGVTVDLGVREPGFLSGEPVRVVPAEGAPELVLREAPGADLPLTVLDGRGRPLPGARVAVQLPRWVWLEDGVQRVGLVTGPGGRLRLPNLPLRPVRISVRYGTRRAKATARAPHAAVIRLPR